MILENFLMGPLIFVSVHELVEIPKNPTRYNLQYAVLEAGGFVLGYWMG